MDEDSEHEKARFASMTRHRSLPVLAVAVCATVLAACTSSTPSSNRSTGSTAGAATTAAVPGIGKIKHVIVVMQENRSFDTYFGTYPGADGIPMQNGEPTVCLPNPAGGCNKPFHDTNDVNGGGPHGQDNAAADVDDGKMDG